MGQLTPNCGTNMTLVECIYHMNDLPLSYLFKVQTVIFGWQGDSQYTKLQAWVNRIHKPWISTERAFD
jgi:hypothetical protein